MNWNDPKEVLPEDQFRVLITNGISVMEGYRLNGRWYDTAFDNDKTQEVRFWGELPNPPGKETPKTPTITLT